MRRESVAMLLLLVSTVVAYPASYVRASGSPQPVVGVDCTTIRDWVPGDPNDCYLEYRDGEYVLTCPGYLQVLRR